MKKLSALALTLLLSLSTPSHAMIGAFLPAGPTVAGLGLVFFAGGVFANLYTLAIGSKVLEDVPTSNATWAMVFGVVIMDKNNPNSIKLSLLDQDSAQKLALSTKQTKAYNDSLPVINQIGKAVTKSCTTKFIKAFPQYKDGQDFSADQIQWSLNCGENTWRKYQKANSKVFSQEAFEAVEAIRNQNS